MGDDANEQRRRAEEHLREADRYLRSAQRWSRISLWGSGCVLVLYGIVGLGLDGEVPAAQLRRYAEELAGERPWFRLDRGMVALFAEVLAWHLSEATGLLWLAATGGRGMAEIRGDGLLVELDDRPADVHRFDHGAVLARNPAAGALRATRSLADAEACLVALGSPTSWKWSGASSPHATVASRVKWTLTER
jgi:hypothetical protein